MVLFEQWPGELREDEGDEDEGEQGGDDCSNVDGDGLPDEQQEQEWYGDDAEHVAERGDAERVGGIAFAQGADEDDGDACGDGGCEDQTCEAERVEEGLGCPGKQWCEEGERDDEVDAPVCERVFDIGEGDVEQ